MKTSVALLLMMAAFSAMADDGPAVQVLDTGVTTTRTYNVFGGQPAKLDLSVRTGQAGKVDLTATLVQIANKFSSVMTNDIPLAAAVSSGRITVSLPFPKVRGRTQFAAVFHIKSGGKIISAGSAVFNVYPQDFFKSGFADIQGDTRLEIFGKGKYPGEFLKSQGIKFDNGGASLPDQPQAGSVYIGLAGAEDLAQWVQAHPAWHGGLIVFCADTGLLPGVYFETHGDGRIAKVTLPFPSELSSDPAAQSALLEIFNNIIPHTKP